MLSLVVALASTAMAKQVAFVAEGATYTGDATQVAIPNGEIVGATFTAAEVCSIQHTQKNSSKSQVTGGLVRWYANDIMTITPLDGISISKIEINCSTASYANALGNTVIDGSKIFTVSGSVATYSPNLPFTGSLTFAPTAQVRFSSIVVTYEDGVAVAAGLPVVKFGNVIADNNGEYDVVAGTEVTVTSTGAESILVTSTSADDQTIEGDTYNFTVDADEMYEFTGVNNVGSSEKFTVSFTVVEAPKTGGVVYTLVKSANELVAGETYTIACADKGVAMSSEAQANYRPQIEVSVENGSFEANDNILAFVLEGESGNWNMSTRNYAGTDGYFDMGSKESDNYLTVVSSPCSWSIDINEAGDAEIKSAFNANTTRYVKYNASASRFATYKSGQAAVQLYREEVVAPKIFINEEEVFAGHVVDLVAGDKVIIRGHEANELHYKLDVNLAGMRAPATDTEGWVKHDSNEFTYEVPEGFENMSISLAAKAVNNGKESTPLQFTVSEGTSTGINGVEAEDAAAKTEWFTIQGVRVAAPAESGLYIRRQGSKVEKVVL